MFVTTPILGVHFSCLREMFFDLNKILLSIHISNKKHSTKSGTIFFNITFSSQYMFCVFLLSENAYFYLAKHEDDDEWRNTKAKFVEQFEFIHSCGCFTALISMWRRCLTHKGRIQDVIKSFKHVVSAHKYCSLLRSQFDSTNYFLFCGNTRTTSKPSMNNLQIW